MDKLLSVFERVSKLSHGHERDIRQAAEELGEIAKAYRFLLLEEKDKEKRLADFKEEVCDLAICCFSLFSSQNPTSCESQMFWDLVDQKISKWENS